MGYQAYVNFHNKSIPYLKYTVVSLRENYVKQCHSSHSTFQIPFLQPLNCHRNIQLYIIGAVVIVCVHVHTYVRTYVSMFELPSNTIVKDGS